MNRSSPPALLATQDHLHLPLIWAPLTPDRLPQVFVSRTAPISRECAGVEVDRAANTRFCNPPSTGQTTAVRTILQRWSMRRGRPSPGRRLAAPHPSLA